MVDTLNMPGRSRKGHEEFCENPDSIQKAQVKALRERGEPSLGTIDLIISHFIGGSNGCFSHNACESP